MIAAAIVSLALSLIVRISDSTSIPQYDVDAFCKKFFVELNGSASIGSIGAQSLINKCIEEEQYYYDNLTSTWPSVPEEIRIYCIKETDFFNNKLIGYNFYRLSGCISREYKSYTLQNEAPEHFQ